MGNELNYHIFKILKINTIHKNSKFDDLSISTTSMGERKLYCIYNACLSNIMILSLDGLVSKNW